MEAQVESGITCIQSMAQHSHLTHSIDGEQTARFVDSLFLFNWDEEINRRLYHCEASLGRHQPWDQSTRVDHGFVGEPTRDASTSIGRAQENTERKITIIQQQRKGENAALGRSKCVDREEKAEKRQLQDKYLDG